MFVLPFLVALSFEIRSRLQICFKNYTPCCSLRVAHQSKNGITNVCNFEDFVNTNLSSHIVYKLCVAVATLLQRNFFVRASEHQGITPLIGKFIKTPKEVAIFDHMLLDDHKVSSVIIFRYF